MSGSQPLLLGIKRVIIFVVVTILFVITYTRDSSWDDTFTCGTRELAIQDLDCDGLKELGVEDIKVEDMRVKRVLGDTVKCDLVGFI